MKPKRIEPPIIGLDFSVEESLTKEMTFKITADIENHLRRAYEIGYHHGKEGIKPIIDLTNT